nr:IS5 family transposase [Streptomyces chattanoogensis]
MERMPYATDLSDEQWSLIEPLVTAWKQERVARSTTGDPGSCDLREVVNALLYQNRTGCQWRLLPHDLPAWSAVFYYFTLWRQDGLDQRIQEILRCQVRERARRLEDPSLVIIDTQSVRVAAGVPKTTTGLDANKKTPGRKRGLAVDVLGLITGVVVLPASAHDNEAGIALLDQAVERCGLRAAQSATVYQRIVTAFNEYPGKVFRVRDLYEHLGLPTDEPSINVTRSRLSRLVRQGLLEQPGRGQYQKRT